MAAVSAEKSIWQSATWQSALAPAGPQARVIWHLWQSTFWLCAAVFAAVLASVAYAVWRTRSAAQDRPREGAAPLVLRKTHWVIGAALVLSTLGIVSLFASDVVASRALRKLTSDDALHIELTARQWWWRARYLDAQGNESFTTANELHLPAGRTVVLDLTSDDVIHSLWLPNLNGKLDLIPGRPAQMRLRADRPGLYRGQCAEFCGLEHASMALTVTVHSSQDYARWAAAQARPSPVPTAQTPDAVRRGLQVFIDQHCAQCHTVRGTAANGTTGPDLTHFASRSTLAAGLFPNTRGHRAGWILDAPALKTGVAMPPVKLTADDLQALLDYMETLQ